ncbi:hypothetical protein C2U72_03650 [Prosthecomicrobium hirschii]|uniref:hypothetical protein n=1 Tax=Prosthecodimorpha hirschii TaxID=665126 RepID=UPI00112B6012|nr:hypothetical protein [Prosthecomicrobium hirschii]TPQ52349.1 hypothetical protein C2U72_03650 [Prosthecomicrobium hirschii]
MVNLNTNRIAHTPTGNQNVASLDDIVNVASQSKADGHIRAKSDGLGGVVVYGHKGGFRSLFNKSNPQRQDAGTLEVKKSVDNYVQGKNPKVQALADRLMSRFVNQDGNVVARMTNQDVIAIKQQLDDAERIAGSIDDLARSLQNGGDLTTAFKDNLPGIAFAFGQINGGNKSNEVDLAVKGLCIPELGAGTALAIIDNLNNGAPLDDGTKTLLKALFPKDSFGGKADLDKVFRDFETSNNRDNLVNDLCGIANRRWFNPESILSSEKARHYGIRTPNDQNAPLFLDDLGARHELQGFGDADPSGKLGKLKNAYEKHMSARNEINEPIRDYLSDNRYAVDWDAPKNMPYFDRNHSPSPSMALMSGLDRLLSAVRIG